MILSHKHKFIFIKTFKTASTSLEIALSEYCGEKDIITPISEKDEKLRERLDYRGPQNYKVPFSQYSNLDLCELLYNRKWFQFYNHMPAIEVRKYIDREVWDNYYKFCFERNPYDKIISKYYWVGEKKYKSLKDFILSGRATKVTGFDLYTEFSLPIVDKVYKYENMTEALKDITEKVGFDKELSLPPKKAKGSLRKDKRHYSEILTEEEKQLISRLYAREIAYWDYNF